MFAFLLVIAAQAGTVSNSPPPVVSTVVPPPPVIVPVAPPPLVMPSDFFNRPVTTIAVRASLGSAILLDDRFRVGRSGASFNQNRSETGEGDCQPTYANTARQSLSVNIRPEGPSKDHYRVSVNLMRPSGTCEASGSRGVSVEQTVELKPGQSASIQGDGGLRVDLSRR